MLLAVLAPVLALMAFSGYVVQEKLDLYRDSADLLTAAQISRSAHALARDLQSERALSAVYISSSRNADREELDDQRDATDQRLVDFRAELLSPKAISLFGDSRPDQVLGQLDAARAGVDGDGDIKEVMGRYNEVIGALISSSSRVNRQNLSNLVAAYMDLGNVKDRIARERSIGLSWQQRGRVDRDLLALFAEAHAEKKAFIESFRGHASAAQIKIFDEVVQGPLLDEIERLHALALAGKLKASDTEAWNRTHVALSNLIVVAEERLSAEMEREINASLTNAKLTFYVVVFVVVILVLFSLETLRRSERRATVAEEEARKLFRAVEQSPVSVMITDPTGTVEYVNPAFARMTGFSRDEVTGRNPRLLRSEQTPRTVYQDMWQTIRSGQEWRGEIVNKRRDGSVYWEQMTIAPVKAADGRVINYIALKEDVTEVRTLRLALEREHATIQRILTSTHDAIALIDEEGRFEYANPALVAEFGPTDGRDCAEYFGSSANACPSCRSDRLDETSREEWRSEATGKTYELTSTPVVSADGGRSLLQVFHDITVRKQAEEALRTAREAAEIANRAKSEFLATMSHELRTPLNAIIGFSEIIEGELLGPVGQQQYVEYAKDINDSGRHLLQLINDILDVARIEVGRVELREGEVDAGAVLRAAVKMVRERAEAKSVALSTDIPDDLPLLLGDERRLKQILVNLLGNGVKFTPAGGMVDARVAFRPTGEMEIVVRDTGIGIAAEDIGKIMAPFGQADSSLARRYEGSGLGLPLSRKLMELHGGTLTLASRPGSGTAVTLTFPAERVRQPA
ncbi:MAG: nitrate- and nitrite sensing domain-containing protein [Solirubrobacterales bacterium]